MLKVSVKHTNEHYIKALYVKSRQSKTEERTSEKSALVKAKKIGKGSCKVGGGGGGEQQWEEKDQNTRSEKTEKTPRVALLNRNKHYICYI